MLTRDKNRTKSTVESFFESLAVAVEAIHLVLGDVEKRSST